MDDDGAARHVPRAAVPEADHAVVEADQGDRQPGVGQDVAEVTRVSLRGEGTGVLIHVGVKVPPGGLAGVAGVPGHVDVEAVFAGVQPEDLALDDDPPGVAVELQPPRDIGAPGHQVHN